MSYFVYIHTCPNNKRYIGVTSRKPKYRWKSGKGYGNQTFGRAVNKYGWDNIDHKVFEVDTKSEMYYLEKYLISYYQTTNSLYGYNKSTGGEIGPIGNKFTEEQIQKLKIARKGFVLSNESRLKISNTLKGHKFSEESIRKMKKSHGHKVMVDGNIYDSIKEAVKSINGYENAFYYALNHSGIYKGHKIKYL